MLVLVDKFGRIVSVRELRSGQVDGVGGGAVVWELWAAKCQSSMFQTLAE